MAGKKLFRRRIRFPPRQSGNQSLCTRKRYKDARRNQRCVIAGGAVGCLIGAWLEWAFPNTKRNDTRGKSKRAVSSFLSLMRPARLLRRRKLLKHTGAQDIASTGEANSDDPAATPVAAAR